jgi:hypothetical protein
MHSDAPRLMTGVSRTVRPARYTVSTELLAWTGVESYSRVSAVRDLRLAGRVGTRSGRNL